MKTSPDRSPRQAIGLRPSGRVWIIVLIALLGFAVSLSARAQSPVDPPSRVARLSEATGQVWLFSTDSNEWVSVARNRPLTTGDRIATDNGARAEITLGTTTLRLDAATEIEIVRLDDSRFHVRLEGGSVAARLRNPQSLAEFEMTTEEGRFRAQTVGRYRFDRFDQASDVTVFNGQAIYELRDTALPVTTGQHAQFWIDQGGVPQYTMLQPTGDAFAGWNDERDRAEDRVAANRYVSPEMTGAEELNRHGDWEQTSDYGALWIPRGVPVGWAPYSAGHWAWIRPWGWTWVDDAPWGFAPFHYGRWVYHRNVWCWAPGTYVARPVYAPALVAWIGGPRVNLSISIGGGGPPVGWFPLAPREVYVPAYRTSTRYVRQVNVTHVSNVTNITTIVNNRNGEADRRDFANRRAPHAVTFVPTEVMQRREPVAPVAARLRNDPQVRALVADASPAPVVSAPPVTAPALAPRQAQGRPPPRPPFEARGPGGFAGRPDAAPSVARPDGVRPEFGRGPGTRSEPGRGGDRIAPPSVAPQVAAPPVIGATPAPGVTRAAPPVAPTGVTPAGPPVGARGVVEPSTGRPATRGGSGRDGVAGETSRPDVIVLPSPAQRSAQPGEAFGRPGFRGRDVADDDRGGPKQMGIPRYNAPRDGAPATREAAQRPPLLSRPPEAAVVTAPQRPPPTAAVAPPQPQRPPPTAAVAPPQPHRPPPTAAVAPPQPQRPPTAAVAPPAVQQAAPPVAPPAAQRAAGGEQRMTRPEQPRNREERRDEKGDRGEKQR